MAASRKLSELFVSRVPWNIAHREVREYFGQFGTVRKCQLAYDKNTGFHRGHCWVGFTTEEALDNAIQKDTHVIDGAKLLVQKNRRPFEWQQSNKADEDD